MVKFNNVMTGLQIGGGIVGGLGAIAVTKSLLDEAKELLPYALGGIGLLGSIVLIIKFA
jgi:hypothetical protein